MKIDGGKEGQRRRRWMVRRKESKNMKRADQVGIGRARGKIKRRKESKLIRRLKKKRKAQSEQRKRDTHIVCGSSCTQFSFHSLSFYSLCLSVSLSPSSLCVCRVFPSYLFPLCQSPSKALTKRGTCSRHGGSETDPTSTISAWGNQSPPSIDSTTAHEWAPKDFVPEFLALQLGKTVKPNKFDASHGSVERATTSQPLVLPKSHTDTGPKANCTVGMRRY